MRRERLVAFACTVAFAAALTAGCVMSYVAVGGTMSLPEYGVEATLPPGWYQATRAQEMFVVTRDGFLLQNIRLQRVEIEKDLKSTKRKFDAKMPPLDVAEVELDEARTAPAVGDFALEENAPATVAGRPGFRLVYTWKTKEGLRLTRVHYGFLDGKWVYRLIYQAAARYYFDKDLAAFERVRQSLKLLAGSA